MKAGVAAAAALAFLTLSRLGSACACGVPGLESALTSPGDRWGVRLTQALSLGHGRWSASGDYRPLAANAHDRRYELEAMAAIRPHAPPYTARESGESIRKPIGPADWR